MVIFGMFSYFMYRRLEFQEYDKGGQHLQKLEEADDGSDDEALDGGMFGQHVELEWCKKNILLLSEGLEHNYLTEYN